MSRGFDPYREGPTMPGWRTAASPDEIREIREFHRPFWEKDLRDARQNLDERLAKVLAIEKELEERAAALDERGKAIVASEVKMRKLIEEYCSAYEKRDASISTREASISTREEALAARERELSSRAAELDQREAAAKEHASSSDAGRESYQKWWTLRHGELNQRVHELERSLEIARAQCTPPDRLLTLQRWEALVAERVDMLKVYIEHAESLSRRAWSTRVCIKCLRMTESDRDFFWVAGKECGHILCSMCTGDVKTCPICGMEHAEGFVRLH